MTYLNLPPVWNLEICTCYVLNKDEPNIPHYLTIFLSYLLLLTKQMSLQYDFIVLAIYKIFIHYLFVFCP